HQQRLRNCSKPEREWGQLQSRPPCSPKQLCFCHEKLVSNRTALVWAQRSLSLARQTLLHKRMGQMTLSTLLYFPSFLPRSVCLRSPKLTNLLIACPHLQ